MKTFFRVFNPFSNENFFRIFNPFSIFIILSTTFRFSHECEKFPISLVDYFSLARVGPFPQRDC